LEVFKIGFGFPNENRPKFGHNGLWRILKTTSAMRKIEDIHARHYKCADADNLYVRNSTLPRLMLASAISAVLNLLKESHNEIQSNRKNATFFWRIGCRHERRSNGSSLWCS